MAWKEKRGLKRSESQESFIAPDILNEAKERISQRIHNYLRVDVDQKSRFLERTPFLKELHEINGYPKSFIITRLMRVNPLSNASINVTVIHERIMNIINNISNTKSPLWKRVVAVENLRSAFATENFKDILLEYMRQRYLRVKLVEILKNRNSRPLLEETCLTIMYIFYSIGNRCSRKTSLLLTKALIEEFSFYLTKVTNHCNSYKTAKAKYLDKKLILGEKAKDLRFWFPNFRNKRASTSVHHVSSSLLFYALAFLLFHSRQMPVVCEIALNIRCSSKPMRFYLLNILDVIIGHFQFMDLVQNPKLPKQIYYLLMSIPDEHEMNKDIVTNTMITNCCRKLYSLCYNTSLHFHARQIAAMYCVPMISDHDVDSETSSLKGVLSTVPVITESFFESTSCVSGTDSNEDKTEPMIYKLI